MKKLTKNELQVRFEKLVMEMELLFEIYQNKKEYQQRLTRLSVELSDVYAQLNGLPAINDIERQQWQKAQKVGYKQYFNIEMTIQILTTKHGDNLLTPEEEEVVLNLINTYYDELKHLDRKSEEYKTKYRIYLGLKSKLEEVKVKSKSVEMPIKLKSKIYKYTINNVKGALKNLYDLREYDVEAYNDIMRALQVASFTHNQIVAINQALDEGRVDKALSKDYELAVKKVVKALNEKNVYKMKVINHFF